MKKGMKVLLSLMLVLFFAVGIKTAENNVVQAEDVGVTPTASPTTASTGSAVDVSPSPVPTETPDLSQAKLNKTSTTIMAGKKTTLKVSGTTATPVWTSSDDKIATVSEKGVVKGKKKGTATITATIGDVPFTCTIHVVNKMSKNDFKKFNKENFITYCKRKGYDGGYAWSGQWKGRSKKKSTYRGIKIGKSKSQIIKKYGEMSFKKCKKSDPFTKMKGLKRNKVKTYGDVTYGKYRIRFYLNKKNKVVAIILACNIGRIKKSSLIAYI